MLRSQLEYGLMSRLERCGHLVGCVDAVRQRLDRCSCRSSATRMTAQAVSDSDQPRAVVVQAYAGVVLVLVPRPEFAEPLRADCSAGEVPPLDGHAASASCRCVHGDAAWRPGGRRSKEFAARRLEVRRRVSSRQLRGAALRLPVSSRASPMVATATPPQVTGGTHGSCAVTLNPKPKSLVWRPNPWATATAATPTMNHTGLRRDSGC